jgi:hypothetical protein
MADDIDVKAEGKSMRSQQAKRMRDTANDQQDVYRYVKRNPKATKQDAAKGEMYDIMSTDPGTEERKTAIRKRMYLENNLPDKKRVAGKKTGGVHKQGMSTVGGKKRTAKKRVAGK